MSSCDHFLHDLPTGGLQLPHSAAGQKPHALVFVAAVNNIHAVARDRVMKCGAGVLGDEPEESLPPRVLGVTEHLSAKFLKFFNADPTNRFGERFATLFAEFF